MFIQLSPVYFSNRIAMKLLKLNILSINTKAKLSTKNKTHYDTLKVSPNATHNEIKTAYYQLTLQYHPDKNKSDSAREIFQDIAEAYEVVGNYQSRKQYDRSIAVTRGNINQMQRPKTTYSENVSSSSRQHYDFDAWTRTHYSNTFETIQQKQYVYQMYVKNKEELMKSRKNNQISSIAAAIISIVLIAFISVYESQRSNDTTSNKKQD